MISIIIPTFNRQHKTERAISSVASQNVDAEILVIDDASNPPFQLPAIYQQEKNIRVIRNETNRGAAAARNTGIKNANHDLLSFLDSDDYLIADTFKDRIDFAVENGVLSEKGMTHFFGCSWKELDLEGKATKVRHPKSSVSPDDLFSGCWFCPGSAIIINRNLFLHTDILFDENLSRLEDLDLFLRLGTLGVSFTSQSIVGVGIAQSDSRYPDIVIKACREIQNKHLSKGTSLSKGLQSRLKAYLFYELSKAHMNKGEYHRSLDNLIKSFIQRPRVSMYPGPGWNISSL